MATNKGWVLKFIKSKPEFETIIQSITQEQSYLIAQQVDQIKFVDFKNSFNCKDLLMKGRIFNQEFEIRYELSGSDYHLLVFAEEKSNLNGLENPLVETEYDSSEEYNIFLWGKAKKIKNKETGEGDWKFIEVQIPKVIEYPEIEDLAENNELVINAYDYKTNEQPVFTRFLGVGKYDHKDD